MSGILDDLKLQYKLGGPEQRLIYVNVAVFVLSIVFFYDFRFGAFDYPSWLGLSSDARTVLYHPWTLLTYAFFHGGFLHLLFNMLVLNFSGMLFRTYFSAKQFLGAYLLGAMFSGLVFIGVYALLGKSGLLVGASAGIASSPRMNACAASNVRSSLASGDAASRQARAASNSDATAVTTPIGAGAWPLHGRLPRRRRVVAAQPGRDLSRKMPQPRRRRRSSSARARWGNARSSGPGRSPGANQPIADASSWGWASPVAVARK